MLYEIGMLIILISCAFCGGSALVPFSIAMVGALLMAIGRRKHNGKHTNSER
jgi:hypothetical protein